MKYWRGYLVAAIVAACSWGLQEFAKAHSVLVDMIYPYMTRLVQNYLAEWSAGVDFCVWQVVLLALIAILLASIVLMIVLKWNPIQWFGWVLAGASVLLLLHTGLYGLNEYAGPLAEDIRLENAEYTYSVSELEEAAVYYRDQANALADKISRDGSGQVQNASFSELALQAADGFETLTYQEYFSVFAGSTVPVKELGFSGSFTDKGVTGITVALTGESAVNPEIPAVCLPFAMCHEMAHRMCIAVDRDADFAAFMACKANASPQFQYAAYFMAYRACYSALESVSASTGLTTSLQSLTAGENANLRNDLQTYDAFFGDDNAVDGEFCNLLVVWHVQTVVLPSQAVEEQIFDPQDETQVDLTGIVNAKTDE